MIRIHPQYTCLRACALYSMVEESSDVLDSCPTRKKDFSAFFYIFSSYMQGKRQNIFVQSEKTQMQLFFSFSDLQLGTGTPCRDPSTVGYT